MAESNQSTQSTVPQVVYLGVVITYDEQANRWRFTIDGMERSSETLALAKNMIAHPPKPKKKFEPFECWTRAYGDWAIVRVTSFVEGGFHPSREMWVSKGGDRRKIWCRNGHPRSPAVDAKIAKLQSLDKQVQALEERGQKIESNLPVVEYPDEKKAG